MLNLMIQKNKNPLSNLSKDTFSTEEEINELCKTAKGWWKCRTRSNHGH